MTPLVTVIVPVLHDRALAHDLLARLPVDSRAEFVIVEAEPALEPAVIPGKRPDVRLMHARQGRAQQMNAGASQARGEWLLFLHADSRLPSDWLEIFGATVSAPVVGGWFRFALDDSAWQARVIERGVALRVALFMLPYGDQGLFVRRSVFTGLNGYRELALMEDVDFVRRLKAAGPVVEIPRPILTSPRRWLRDGWFRRSARNLTLLTLFFCGVSSERLARWY